MSGKEKKIQDYDFWYTFLRPTVDTLFRWSMRRYRCVGRENLPQNGQIIFAPNHQNGLIDALAVLSLDSRPKVFVSRADIHRNPKLRRILSWLKIMPINRMRDGVDSVRHNDETMDRAVSVLQDGVPFVIMPEGTHRRMHSLLPLQKGIFRIAMRAATSAQTDPQTNPVWIVPVGLEYGDWDQIWDSLTICIGQPINVNDYLATHPDETEPQQILGLRSMLSDRLQKLILYLPDNEQYPEAWMHLDANRPSPWKKPQHHLPQWARAILLVLGAPLFLLCGLLTFPIWLPLWIVKPKIKDVAFRNSAEFVWTWLLLPFSLWLATPFWFYIKEYLYQIRHFNNVLSVGKEP